MTLIIGGGVSGFSTGIRLLEAGRNATIWARDLSPHTTSNVAAAIWYPYKAYPIARVLGWSATTFGAFAALAGDAETGVVMREGIELFAHAVEDPWWQPAVPRFRRARANELPSGYRDGYVFTVPIIEMDVYLPYLIRRFERLGGRVEQRAVRSFDQAFQEHDTVINCAGLGSRQLAGDAALTPIRGQVVRVAQIGMERFIMDDHGQDGIVYIIPRANDIILGGVAEEGRELMEPEAATATAILQRCMRLEPRLREAAVLEHRVGLRPGRTAVRLEQAQYAPGKRLIHNYGHGGAGVTLSWGCAAAVVELL